ncbi:MAG: outer membrane protein assembly factor BamD [Candidatus Omnitrophica bacterium]|nr:outer membrane protein assembly factor BamD [Candidatus Omnitrophota bacterium]
MKRRVLIFSLLIICLTVSKAYPFWIWSPKTGKWLNPKTAVKPDPKDQFVYANDLFEGENYKEAKREFKKLLTHYPRSLEAAESQYYLGLIEEKVDNPYQAYLEFQKVIDKYPFSERIQEIIEREYNIAEAFMSGEKRKVLGVTLPVENPAIEILYKVIENSYYGPLAPKAQYKLGLVLKGLMRYYEAEESFNKVISNYPKSEWVEPAKYQIALARAAVSRGPDYDQGATQEAQEKFATFIEEHPDAVLSNKAEDNITELKEKEAESNYNTARFYEKQNKLEAARIYYGDVIGNHPNSPWAAKALERLHIMEKVK